MSETKPLYEAQIGDRVRMEELVVAGGKFYVIEGDSYCDLPTMTFRLTKDDATMSPNRERVEGYERIE